MRLEIAAFFCLFDIAKVQPLLAARGVPLSVDPPLGRLASARFFGQHNNEH